MSPSVALLGPAVALVGCLAGRARDSMRDAIDRENRGDSRGALELGLRVATVDRPPALTLWVARWQLALGRRLPSRGACITRST